MPRSNRHKTSTLAAAGVGAAHHGGPVRKWLSKRPVLSTLTAPERTVGPVPKRRAIEYILAHSAKVSRQLRGDWSFADVWRDAIASGGLDEAVPYKTFYPAIREYADILTYPPKKRELMLQRKHRLARAAQQNGAAITIDAEVVVSTPAGPAVSPQSPTPAAPEGEGAPVPEVDPRDARRRRLVHGRKTVAELTDETLRASLQASSSRNP